MSAQQLGEKGVFRLHPSFRLVALAIPPTAKQNWLSPEAATIFSFHKVELPTCEEEARILEVVCPGASEDVIADVLGVSKGLQALRYSLMSLP